MKKHRFGLILIAVLAILILLVNLVTASYSWFSPSTLSGKGLKFLESDFMRTENCELSLYGSTVSSGAIIYNDSPVESGSTVTATVTSSTDVTEGLNYYRIVVNNKDENNSSNVSLNLKNCTVYSGTTIGIVSPTNACYKFTQDTSSGVYLVRNANVKKHISTDEKYGQLIVDFYVRCSTAFEFGPDNIEILYN